MGTTSTNTRIWANTTRSCLDRFPLLRLVRNRGRAIDIQKQCPGMGQLSMFKIKYYDEAQIECT